MLPENQLTDTMSARPQYPRLTSQVLMKRAGVATKSVSSGGGTLTQWPNASLVDSSRLLVCRCYYGDSKDKTFLLADLIIDKGVDK